MNIFYEFYELFEIRKIKFKEPSRTVDSDNNICEFYISETYPAIEPVFFDLLDILGKYTDFKHVLPADSFKIKEELVKIFVYLYEQLPENKKKELKKDIQEVFNWNGE